MNTEEKKEGFTKVVDFFAKLGTKVKVEEVAENRADNLVKFAKDKESVVIEKFEDLKLITGEMVMIEPAVEVGAAIAMQVEEEWIPAPAGKYELEDGRIVIVNEGEDGMIGMVEEVAADGEVVTEEEMESDSPKRVIESIVKEKIFAKQDEFEALKKEFEEVKKENKFLLESLEEKKKSEVELEDKFKQLTDFSEEMFKKLLSEPSKEPKVNNKNPLQKEKKRNIFYGN